MIHQAPVYDPRIQAGERVMYVEVTDMGFTSYGYSPQLAAGEDLWCECDELGSLKQALDTLAFLRTS
jgi:hypothetical protein